MFLENISEDYTADGIDSFEASQNPIVEEDVCALLRRRYVEFLVHVEPEW